MESMIPSLDQQSLPPSLDARFLREEARQRIEQLAGERWTDYNTHDPGITILEILAYAITDLGLRTHLDIADLIAGSEEKPFFTAREVLPSAAYTSDDYHRLLVDQPEVRNAWVETSDDDIKGIFSLLIDLDSEEDEIDINEVRLKGEVTIPVMENGTLIGRRYDFFVIFPYWEELPAVWNGEKELKEIIIDTGNIQAIDEDYYEAYDKYFITYQSVFGEGDQEEILEEQEIWIRLPRGIPKDGKSSDDSDLNTIFSDALQEKLNNDFFTTHLNRVRHRIRQLEKVRRFIRQHRNLGEDWGEINTTRIQHIGLNIENLELQPEADAEGILARIYFSIGQFIRPRLQSQTFEQLLEKNRTPDKIFEGPLFEHGFISKDEPDQQQGDKIYTSDLVRLIMQIPGVIGVSGLTLSHYLGQFRTTSGIRNCLRLRNPKIYKPKLSFYDADIKVFKRGVSLSPNRDKVEQHLTELRAAYRQNLSSGNSGDLPIPPGDDQLDIKTFHSIQNEFPEVYGLRKGEIVKTASRQRKAQAKQLKGYLLFFEQLLVNYSAQLANLQQLFSINGQVERTYFFQPLYQVPAVKDLILVYAGQTEQDWSSFQQSCNQYIRHLEDHSEDRSTFIRRRHQFLDHLLARLGEDFSNYTAWSYAKNDGAVSPGLVFDKLRFLQQFPELSSRRATAFDYSATNQAWNTENVSGFAKRVAALLGMPDPRRRSLARTFNIQDYVQTVAKNDDPEAFRFYLWNGLLTEIFPGDGNTLSDPEKYQVLLLSPAWYNQPELEARIAKLAELGSNADHYELLATQNDQSTICRYYYRLTDKTGDAGVIGRRYNYYPSRAEPAALINEAVQVLQGRLLEGMHVVEHLLLRPLTAENKILKTIKFREAGNLPLIPDPYSFQVSIFLPGWAPRFQDLEFRAVVEQTLRREMPAHLFAWIYWVELDQEAVPQVFLDFEPTYRNWLENREDVSALDDFVEAFNTLVQSEFVTLTNKYKPFAL